MGWYDFFSRFYDRSLETLYRDTRVTAAEALDVEPGQLVLDVPCGTGQSLDELVPKVGSEGTVVGMDLSAGMLGKATKRASQWPNVVLEQCSVEDIDPARLEKLTGKRHADRVHVFLGMSAFPDMQRAFAALWSVLAEGGRIIIVDVYAERLSLQGRMVNLVARADIRRESWTPLERAADDFERRELPSMPDHGGQLFLATGTK